jgi:hypothetical protein
MLISKYLRLKTKAKKVYLDYPFIETVSKQRQAFLLLKVSYPEIAIRLFLKALLIF